jgi:hypothetical protein
MGLLRHMEQTQFYSSPPKDLGDGCHRLCSQSCRSFPPRCQRLINCADVTGLVSEREKFGPLSSLFLRESHGIGPDKAFGGLEPWTRMIWVGPGDGLPIWNF